MAERQAKVPPYKLAPRWEPTCAPDDDMPVLVNLLLGKVHVPGPNASRSVLGRLGEQREPDRVQGHLGRRRIVDHRHRFGRSGRGSGKPPREGKRPIGTRLRREAPGRAGRAHSGVDRQRS
ncbi:hypothetical protein [Amycolatopsis anabasis]|uniref:hypothetical protein n=1 Tax=Amycolatopsis anabasis TaxID=1840409 RepID=UPI00131CF896